MFKIASISILSALLFLGCTDEQHSLNPNQDQNESVHLVNDINPYGSNGQVKVVIEISAGSNEKWEVNKKTGKLERDSIYGNPRTIEYLGYPTNYGFVPQTILPKELGGDGDPLDAIVLGNSLQQGSIASCTIIGLLRLKDRGEQDDKLILAEVNSQFTLCTTLNELNDRYPGMLISIKDWFIHYKGLGKMISEGYTNKTQAENMIEVAHQQFLDNSK